jgi:hypothetical protein
MSAGWICLHRDIANHWIMQDSEALKLWIHLLFKANWQEHKSLLNSKLVVVPRGSLIGGRMALSEQTRISENKIRKYLKALEIDRMITIKKTPKYSIISITNYDQYQDKNHQATAKPPATHPPSDPHNNNLNHLNHLKEGEKPKAKRFTPPSLDDVLEFMTEKGCTDNSQAQLFIDHYSSNGWMVGKNKMKLWKSAASGWLNRMKQFGVNNGNGNNNNSKGTEGAMERLARVTSQANGQRS